MFKGVLAEHARRNVIGSEELDNAGFMIHELEEKVCCEVRTICITDSVTCCVYFSLQVMKPFDEHLTALRAQIMKPHVQYNEETLLEISNLIRTSEVFLKTAQVQKKPGLKVHALCI